MQFGILVVFTALVSPGFAAPILDDCGNFFKKVLRIATKVDIQNFEHLMKFDELKTVKKNIGSYKNSSYFIKAKNKEGTEKVHYVLKMKPKMRKIENNAAYPTIITAENDTAMKSLFDIYDPENQLMPNTFFVRREDAISKGGEFFLNKIESKLDKGYHDDGAFRTSEGYLISQVDKEFEPLEHTRFSFKDLSQESKENLLINCIVLLNADCMNTGNILIDAQKNARFIDGEYLFSKKDTFGDHIEKMKTKFKEIGFDFSENLKEHVNFCKKIKNYVIKIENENALKTPGLAGFLKRENDRNKELGKPEIGITQILMGPQYLLDLCSK